MENRHVLEQEDRIVRQHALIEKMRTAGLSLTAAEELLADMQALLGQMQTHVSRLERVPEEPRHAHSVTCIECWTRNFLASIAAAPPSSTEIPIFNQLFQGGKSRIEVNSRVIELRLGQT